MTKLLNVIVAVFLFSSCDEVRVNWEIKKTEYFTFHYPQNLTLKSINIDLSNNAPERAMAAITGEDQVSSTISGEIVFEEFTINVRLKNPELDKFTPCPCSDYSDTYLLWYSREFRIIEDLRIVWGRNKGENTHWVELCVGMRDQFYVSEVDEEYFETVKRIFATVRIMN